jgi:hypothetical protein
MSRYRFILFSVFIAGLFLGNVSEKTVGEKYSDEFNVLVTSLRELHPILYRNISKNEFDSDVKNISERLLHTTSSYKAVYMIQELLYKIGSAHCGNLSVYSIQGDSNITKVLPFNVYILNHELYIKNYAADTSYNGAKITSIENSNGTSLIDSLKIFFPLDGHRDVVDYYLQPFFNVLYGAYCCQKDFFSVSTSRGMLNVKAAIRGTPLFEKMVIATDEAYLGNKRVLKEEVTADFGYYEFSGFVSKYKNYKIEDDFFAMIKELNAKKIGNLIIDLRYNEGGDPLMGARMLKMLADKPFRIFSNQYTTLCKKPTYIEYMPHPHYFMMRNLGTNAEDTMRKFVRLEHVYSKLYYPAKDNFKGKIYVITGSVTKSAAPTFCKTLIGQSNVTFVGSETSGGVNYFIAGGPSDSFVEVKLPAMQTVFAFGIELLELKGGSCKTELPKGLIPEHRFNYTIDDLMNKRDLEMEWIEKDIKK